MVSAIDQIEQELEKLNQAIASLAHEFHHTYENYLSALGQTIRQQLILASYHVCTRGYPQQFLGLSLSQQQQLQRDLRQLAKQAPIDLLAKLQPVQPVDFSKTQASESIARSLAAQLAEMATELRGQNLETLMEKLEQADLRDKELEAESAFEEPIDESEFEETDFDETDLDETDLDESDSQDLDTDPGSPQELFAALFHKEELETLPPFDESRPLIPKDLSHWQKALETQLTRELEKLSHSANRAMQQAGILPQRLPEPMLEVAAKADLAPESSVPNVLGLVIEAKGKEATQVIVVRLRLAEIEFGDPVVMNGRSQIRTLMNHLNKIKREYQKKQKQKTIAQAEAAWRSSWYED
jgi:hypothetical protein